MKPKSFVIYLVHAVLLNISLEHGHRFISNGKNILEFLLFDFEMDGRNVK